MKKNKKKTKIEKAAMMMTQQEPNPLVCELLEETKKSILNGFSHENFCFISRLLYKLRPHIKKEEIQTIEEMWRDSFTSSCNEEKLSEHITFLKSRFMDYV